MADEKGDNKKNYNIGHRKRLRERIISSPESLKDYELFETLFFGCHPRRDTKDIAKEVLGKFSSISELINTNADALKNVYGFSDSITSVLLVLKQVVVRSMKCEIEKKELLNQTKLIAQYLRSKIGFKKKENLMALFLDNGYALIKDEVINKGTVNYISTYPREIAEKALILGASYVVLSHNHPSGNVYPSRDDLLMTKRVIESLRGVEIKLLDHIIVSKNDDLSFRSNLIINEDCSFNEGLGFGVCSSFSSEKDCDGSDVVEEDECDVDVDDECEILEVAESVCDSQDVQNLFKSILKKERGEK